MPRTQRTPAEVDKMMANDVRGKRPKKKGKKPPKKGSLAERAMSMVAKRRAKMERMAEGKDY